MEKCVLFNMTAKIRGEDTISSLFSQMDSLVYPVNWRENNLCFLPFFLRILGEILNIYYNCTVFSGTEIPENIQILPTTFIEGTEYLWHGCMWNFLDIIISIG